MSNTMPDGNSKQSQQLIIETNQDTDLFQSTSLHENMIIRLLSARSLEAQVEFSTKPGLCRRRISSRWVFALFLCL